LVHDDEARLAEQRDGDAEALPHSPGETAELLLAVALQIRLLQERRDELAALATVGDALEHGEMIEQLFRRDFGVHAELLREIAQSAAHRLLVAQNVEGVQPHTAG